jgi:hypothetical protein
LRSNPSEKQLQPLDVAIFKHLHMFYDAAICRWLQSNPSEKQQSS